MHPLCSSIWFAEESWCCILSSLQVQNLHKKQLNLGLCSSLVCIAMRCYCELYSALMWELYKLKQWNSLIKVGRNATSSSFLTKIYKTQKQKLSDTPNAEIQTTFCDQFCHFFLTAHLVFSVFLALIAFDMISPVSNCFRTYLFYVRY